MIDLGEDCSNLKSSEVPGEPQVNDYLWYESQLYCTGYYDTG